MNTDISLVLSQATETAAFAGYQWLGLGNKEEADRAAVEAMRAQLNQANISGTIVIGEGEIDEAPMLYIGEALGLGGPEIDLAVDPIEGTRMTAMGQANALAVLAASDKGTLLKAPDMYMEKIVVGSRASNVIDIDLPLEQNLKAIAKALNKPLNELVMGTLAKPRHDEIITKAQQLGVRVYAFPDGDVAASLLVCMPENPIDLMYCIGGSPEGVISAAAIRAMGGNMQAKLLLRKQVKGDNPENQKISNIEHGRCIEMNVEPNQKLLLTDLAKSDNVTISATGITSGDLLNGISKCNDSISTETLIIQGRTRTIKKIKSNHSFSLINNQIHAESL